MYGLVMHPQSDITVQAQAALMKNSERLRSPRGIRATFRGRGRSDFSLLFATLSSATAYAILLIFNDIFYELVRNSDRIWRY